MCRSYIEKVWNIVTHEGNTKLPFALEHIRTTTFGAWESTCEELCFEKGIQIIIYFKQENALQRQSVLMKFIDYVVRFFTITLIA